MADSRRPEEWAPDGQGEPLPDFAKLDGEWIWLNHLFLYQSGSPLQLGAALTIRLERTDGGNAVGVDADRLAVQLGLSAAALRAHNRAGTLFVAGRRDDLPGGAGSVATYRFRVGNAEATMAFEEGIEGSRA